MSYCWPPTSTLGAVAAWNATGSAAESAGPGELAATTVVPVPVLAVVVEVVIP